MMEKEKEKQIKIRKMQDDARIRELEEFFYSLKRTKATKKEIK